MDLIAKSNSMSTAELSQKKAELKLQHKVFYVLFRSVVLVHVNEIRSVIL